jgi:hypothetical protein
MARLYLVRDRAEIERRRTLLAPGLWVEVWQDLYAAGEFWMGEETKGLLDGTGEPLQHALALDGESVRIYYGPRLSDVESLPREESLKARVLSARGIGVAWMTLDQFGRRTDYQPSSPADPIFYLRRPGGTVAHVWRLFKAKREAIVYMSEHFGKDPEALEWAEALPFERLEELVERQGKTS